MASLQQGDLQRVIDALKLHTTYDLSDYSDRSLVRRVEKIMAEDALSLEELVARLETRGSYGEEVMKRVTVNTSELFRDPDIWQTIKTQVLPVFRTQDIVNVWHVGCSRGQEVYSMMMLLDQAGLLDRANVYASDINPAMLEEAVRGEYPFRFNLSYLDNFDLVLNANPLNYEDKPNIPYERFLTVDKERDLIRMHDFLRHKPRYCRSNLVNCVNPFFVRFDLILCRNVMIYFNVQLQNRIFEMFHRNLYPGGALVLGVHELMSMPWSGYYQRLGKVYIRKA